MVSGIGNIYADEALWRAKVHGARIADTLTRKQLTAVLDAAADVMREALAKGGTSFDSLYVNVNGESGYFDRSLDAYGREGESLPPLRRGDAPGEVHEPFVVLLPEMSAAATRVELSSARPTQSKMLRRSVPAGNAGSTNHSRLNSAPNTWGGNRSSSPNTRAARPEPPI